MTECGVFAIVNIDVIAHNIAFVTKFHYARAHDNRTEIGCDLIRRGYAGYPSLPVIFVSITILQSKRKPFKHTVGVSLIHSSIECAIPNILFPGNQ